MKKVYLLAAAILTTSSVFAQRNTPEVAKFDFGPQTIDLADGEVHFSRPGEATVLRGTPFYTEDFSNGLAGMGANGAMTQGGTDQIWKHMMSPTPSNGEWSTGTPDFASTTVANGYVNFDADSVNLPISPNYLDRDGFLELAPIDMTGESSVLVTYEQTLRWCCTQLVINLDVSVDGGVTWQSFDVLNGLNANVGAPNPELVQVNISGLAANQSDVRLRFSWSGVSHYYWAIDDINIIPAASDDLTLLNTSYAATFELEYTMIPVAQAHQFDYSGWVKNQGANAQTGVTLGVSVDGMSNAFTGASAGQTVNVGALNDSIGLTGTTISTVDNYTITYTITQNETDVNPADNMLTQDFAVTDTVYGLHTGSTTGNLGNGTDSYEMGPAMDIYADGDATSITFVPGDNSVVGTLVYGVLYEVDGTGNFVYLANTDDYAVQAGDIQTPTTIKFNVPVSLTQGTTYIVCIGTYGGPDEVTIATAGTAPAQTVFFLDGVDNTWYYMTTHPHIQLNMNPFVGVEDVTENGIRLSQNMPNPTTGFTSIVYDLDQRATNVALNVIDLTGKVVLTVSEGTRPAGQHQINLDVNGLAAGVYYYTLIADDKQMTQKMTVVK